MSFDNNHFISADKREMVSSSYAGLLALPKEAGLLYYATDQKKYFGYDGSALIPLDSSGSNDDYYTESVSTMKQTSGNDAIFDNGGVRNGSLELEVNAPLNGKSSYKYTMGAASLNDWIASEEIIEVPLKARGSQNGLSFDYSYDGSKDKIYPVVKDVTNNEILTTNIEAIDPISGSTKLIISFHIPETCEQIKTGFHVKSNDSGKILIWDDIVITSNPFPMGRFKDDDEVISYGNYLSKAAGNVVVFETEKDNTSDKYITVDHTNGTRYIAIRDVSFNASTAYVGSSSGNMGIRQKTALGVNIGGANSKIDATGYANASLTGILKAGEYVEVFTDGAIADSVGTNFSIKATPIGFSDSYITKSTSVDNTQSAILKVYSNTASIVSQSNGECVETVSRPVSGKIRIQFKAGHYKQKPAVSGTTWDGYYSNDQRCVQIDDSAIYDHTEVTIITVATANNTTDCLYTNVFFNAQGIDSKRSDACIMAPVAVVSEKNPVQLSAQVDQTIIGSYATNVLQFDQLNNSDYVLESYGTRILKTGKYKLIINASYFGHNEVFYLGYVVNGGVFKTTRIAIKGDNNGTGSWNFGKIVFYVDLEENDLVQAAIQATNNGGSRMVRPYNFAIELIDQPIETGYIATSKEEVKRMRSIRSSEEKVVGEWIDGSPLYEKSYDLTGIGSGSVIDASITSSNINTTNGWSKYSGSGFWWKVIYAQDGSSDQSRIELTSTGLKYHHSNFPDIRFAIQYTKN